MGVTAVVLAGAAPLSGQLGADTFITTPLYALALAALLGYFIAGIACYIARNKSKPPPRRR
jgi:hypothetical protein